MTPARRLSMGRFDFASRRILEEALSIEQVERVIEPKERVA